MAHNSQTLVEAAKSRRSIYQLAAESPIPDARIVEIVEQALLYCPSTFNTQTTRCVVILSVEHIKLWDLIINVVKSNMLPELWENYGKARFEGFRNAYGTVLFYEVIGGVESVKAAYGKTKLDADKIQTWQDMTNAMHQYYIWTALSNEGLGCNLQHNNPHINEAVANEFGLPKEWDLKAQLVLGKPVSPPKDKIMIPVEERIKVFGISN